MLIPLFKLGNYLHDIWVLGHELESVLSKREHRWVNLIDVDFMRLSPVKFLEKEC